VLICEFSEHNISQNMIQRTSLHTSMRLVERNKKFFIILCKFNEIKQTTNHNPKLQYKFLALAYQHKGFVISCQDYPTEQFLNQEIQ